jgi:hypothetical protein
MAVRIASVFVDERDRWPDHRLTTNVNDVVARTAFPNEHRDLVEGGAARTSNRCDALRTIPARSGRIVSAELERLTSTALCSTRSTQPPIPERFDPRHARQSSSQSWPQWPWWWPWCFQCFQ